MKAKKHKSFYTKSTNSQVSFLMFLMGIAIFLTLICSLGLFYLCSYPKATKFTATMHGIKLLLYITEIISFITVIITVSKYVATKRKNRLQYTIDIISKIQKDIWPESSYNKFDIEMSKSRKICAEYMISNTFSEAVKNISNSKNKYKIFLLPNSEQYKVLINLKNYISNRVNTLKYYEVNKDAKIRVVNEILVRLYRWSFYIDSNLTDSKTIFDSLRNSVRNFLTNKFYTNGFTKGSIIMANRIKKIWKL